MSASDFFPGAARADWALARFALRDLRGGLRFYGVFIACLVLGIMAIVGVDASSRAFRDGLAQQGAVLLGGDLSFGRALGVSADKEKAFLAQRGRVAEVVSSAGDGSPRRWAAVRARRDEGGRFGLSPDRRSADRSAPGVRRYVFRRAGAEERRLWPVRRPGARRPAEC